MPDSGDPMDCSLPGSSVNGILQARILEWVAIFFSRGLPHPGVKSRSPALQVYSPPTEVWGKPKVKVKVTQSCPTLCDLMDLVHGILQARILERVAFPFSRGSSQPRDLTQVSHISGGFFTSWATMEWVKDREAWRAAVLRFAVSDTT